MARSAAGPRLATALPDHYPVPPDGLCLSHCARAAEDVADWMLDRDDNGWRRNRGMEREDSAAAKELIGRVIAHMAGIGKHAEAARLRVAGPDGYPGMDELKYFAAVLGGRIEMMDCMCLDMPVVTYGDVGPLLFRVGHTLLETGIDKDAAEHWVLVSTYLPHSQPVLYPAAVAPPTPLAAATLYLVSVV